MKVKRQNLQIGYSITGGKISLPYYIVGPDNKGQSIYIQGGIHGGETTFFIFHQLIHELQKTKILGRITLVPICNPYSWNQKIYYYTSGKFSLYDGKDFNRNFPGSSSGTGAERLARQLSNLASDSKFSIDLHTANRSRPYLIIPSKQYLKIAKASNMCYSIIFDMHEATKKGGGMPFTAARIIEKQKSIAIECGSHDEFDQQNIDRTVEGILNILNYLEVIRIRTTQKGKSSNANRQFYIDKLKIYRAPVSGFVKYLVSPEESFSKGQPLYKLYPSATLGKEIVTKAKENGVVIMHADTNTVWEGDYVVEIAPKQNIHPL